MPAPASRPVQIASKRAGSFTRALEEHLVAMLNLDDGEAEPLVKLNQSLIENSQRTLRRLSLRFLLHRCQLLPAR